MNLRCVCGSIIDPNGRQGKNTLDGCVDCVNEILLDKDELVRNNWVLLEENRVLKQRLTELGVKDGSKMDTGHGGGTGHEEVGRVVEARNDPPG